MARWPPSQHVLLQPPQALPTLSRVKPLLCTIAETARAAQDLLPSTRRLSMPVCCSGYTDMTATVQLLLKWTQRDRLWYFKGDRPPKTPRTLASTRSHSDPGGRSCPCLSYCAETACSPPQLGGQLLHHTVIAQEARITAEADVCGPGSCRPISPAPHSSSTPQNLKAHTGSPPAWTAGTGVHLHPEPHRDTGKLEAAAPATEQGRGHQAYEPSPVRLSGAGVSPSAGLSCPGDPLIRCFLLSQERLSVLGH